MKVQNIDYKFVQGKYGFHYFKPEQSQIDEGWRALDEDACGYYPSGEYVYQVLHEDKGYGWYGFTARDAIFWMNDGSVVESHMDCYPEYVYLQNYLEEQEKGIYSEWYVDDLTEKDRLDHPIYGLHINNLSWVAWYKDLESFLVSQMPNPWKTPYSTELSWSVAYPGSVSKYIDRRLRSGIWSKNLHFSHHDLSVSDMDSKTKTHKLWMQFKLAINGTGKTKRTIDVLYPSDVVAGQKIKVIAIEEGRSDMKISWTHRRYGLTPKVLKAIGILGGGSQQQ